MKNSSNLLLIIILSFFVLPSIVFGADDSVKIQVSVDNCNNNGICEPSLGETYSGCPLDLCEPPPVISTTSTTTTSHSVTSGSIVPVQNIFLSSLQSFFSNFLNFRVFIHIKDITNDSFYVEWNRQNKDSYFRLVKSKKNYPSSAFDGVVVFEGKGSIAGPENINSLYYYGLFELGLSGFVPRAFFTTPDKPYLNKTFSGLNSSVSSKNFPKESFGILNKKIEIIQNDKIVPIINNKVNLDPNDTFSVRIFDQNSDISNYLVTLNQIISNNNLVFNLKKGSNFLFTNMKSFGLNGSYLLKIKHIIIPNKILEIREILINFPEKNKNNFNLCGKFVSIGYFVCYESFGPFFHLKNLWDF